jgi:hypothetical protein
MMQREVPYLRPPLATLVLVACVCVPFLQLGAADARHSARKLPKAEIKLISGPTTLRTNESLGSNVFRALLTNHSAEPLLLFVRNGILMNAKWDWSVIDAKGTPIGMGFVPGRGFCGTPITSPEAEAEARHLRNDDLLVLAPGESHEFMVLPGPSDDYVFPSAGTYHLSVTLTYVPPNADYYFDERGKRQRAIGYTQWDFSRLGVDQFAALKNSLSVQATSDTWNLALPSKRGPEGSVIVVFPEIPIQQIPIQIR